ncbi:MAG TPA: hypothetical protein VHW64_19995 [Nocardioides sp.]|uniref:hypothetical protein n=1 Tax=Nocardioides sp. TaxID=35761 RepID=UPI002E37B91B|nr:hypothetical protein [Nocardioides sp.]HEX3932979.1 hypothetical protein [Nocardioides sp.]
MCISAIGTAISACLVGLSVSPAQAADVPVTVHGHDLAGAGLYLAGGSCTTWAPDPIDAFPNNVYDLYKKPGTIGQRAIGWQFGASGGATGEGAGPLVLLNSPASLTNLRFSSYMDTADSGAGNVIAFLAPDGDFSDGYYAGALTLGANSAGWGTWNQVDNYPLTWSHWLGASWASGTVSDTIQGLARSSGSGARAYVGPELGCHGDDWYVDDLRVATTSGTRTYDFEGARTESSFGGWRKLSSPTDKFVWGLKHFVRNYGESDWVDGFAGYRNDEASVGKVGGFVYFGDRGSLYARTYGSKKFHKVSTKSFTAQYAAAFELKHLKKHTDYYFKYPGTVALSPSRSQTLSVDVRAEVRGHLLNKSVFKGARLTVSGQRLPGDAGVKVMVQRKLKGHWRTIGSSRTHRHGKFRVGARAGSVGTWHLRLSVPKAKGNLGNQTGAFTVRIKRRPAPPPPPVIVTPAPCTTCAGAPPDVPVGGKVGKRATRPGQPALATPQFRGAVPMPAPGRSMLIDPALLPGRRPDEG